ncbi:MAG: YicC family protein [Methylacidiphilales bacterium]|nr:YicC family protein [Candidatus Methylacidiphilales bacterium]
MKSMTGFGSAEANVNGRKIKVEITSINSRKGADLAINLPRELAALESSVREHIQKHVSRGRVTVSVFLKANEAGERKLRINRKKLRAYDRELKSIASEIGHAGCVSLEYLLNLPGVLDDEKHEGQDEKFNAKVLQVLEKAVDGFQKSRMREGHFLCRELAGQMTRLDASVARVEARREDILLRYRQNLQKRLEESGLQVALDDERLLKEIVIFSDRCDTTEELTRLRAHFAEARRLLKTPEAIGRNLDFLLQEISREVNTIGSKANDLEVSRRVVELKTELEKIREQVQNLE